MTADRQHEHIDLEQAADFDERILDAAASADVAARVAACPTCAATLDAISHIRSTLSGLPTLTMPTAVTERLDAALAEESQSARVPGGAATVVALAQPARRAARRYWLPAVAGIAAASAIVLVVARQGSTQQSMSSAGAAAATSAAGGAGAAAGVPTTQSGIDYAKSAPAEGRTDSHPLAASSGASGLYSSVPVPGSAAGAAAGTAASASAAAPPPVALTAPTPQPAGSPAAVLTPTVQSGASVRDSAAGSMSLSAAPAAAVSYDNTAYTPLRDQATLDACVARLVDPDTGARPSLIDYASFKGAPAVAVYFPSALAGESEVYVVGVHCGSVTEDLLDYLLHVPDTPP